MTEGRFIFWMRVSSQESLEMRALGLPNSASLGW